MSDSDDESINNAKKDLENFRRDQKRWEQMKKEKKEKLKLKREKKEKEEKKDCYFCNKKIEEWCYGLNLVVNETKVYFCENCYDQDEFEKFRHCGNCCDEVKAYDTMFHCTKCPNSIDVLCQKCHQSHNTLMNIKHEKINNKKQEDDGKKEQNCYFCNEKFEDCCCCVSLFVDDTGDYFCEDCFEKVRYCNICKIEVEPYGSMFYCTKCPESIAVLCLSCYNLHEILTKINH